MIINVLLNIKQDLRTASMSAEHNYKQLSTNIAIVSGSAAAAASSAGKSAAAAAAAAPGSAAAAGERHNLKPHL